MAFPTDNKGRFVVHRGNRFSVVCAVRLNGNSPAKDFLEELERLNKPKLRQIGVQFLKIGQFGHITSKEHYRHEQAEIWSLKSHQHRLPCFRDGNDFVLTHGFVKKKDKWLRADFETAVNIMREDKTRVLKLRVKGELL